MKATRRTVLAGMAAIGLSGVAVRAGAIDGEVSFAWPLWAEAFEGSAFVLADGRAARFAIGLLRGELVDGSDGRPSEIDLPPLGGFAWQAPGLLLASPDVSFGATLTESDGLFRLAGDDSVRLDRLLRVGDPVELLLAEGAEPIARLGLMAGYRQMLLESSGAAAPARPPEIESGQLL